MEYPLGSLSSRPVAPDMTDMRDMGLPGGFRVKRISVGMLLLRSS